MNILRSATALVFVVSSAIAHAQEPAPESLGIGEVVYDGSGCPQGTVGTYVSDDRLAMTLMFDNYAVELTRQNSGKANKSCNIKLKLHAPAGWSVGVISADFRGYGSLDKGVIGEQTSVYRFGANRWSEVGIMRMTGPSATDYINSTNVDPNSVEWSPCIKNDRQAQIMIFTQISLSKYVSASIDYAKLMNESRQLADGIKMVQFLANKQLPRNNPILAAINALHDSAQELRVKSQSRANAANLNAIISKVNATSLQLRNLTLAKKNRRGISALWQIKKFEVSLTNITALVNPATADAKGLMTMDTADAEVKQEYGLMWKKCDPNSVRPRFR